MPACGTQIVLCDFPVRFDPYRGCSHGCKYCFTQNSIRRYDLNKIVKHEGVEALRLFIEGKRNKDTNWCDWDIPLHIGGVSDPLQPVELKHRVTRGCLELLAETGYPYIISTKGALAGSEEYLELMRAGNCLLQISAVCSRFDRIEPGCPTFNERMEIAEKAAPLVKRVIIRMQPYMLGYWDDCLKALESIARGGAYGVVFEGLKVSVRGAGMVKLGADYVFEPNRLFYDFCRLREKAHDLGLKFYSGENRFRRFGDSLSCCGADGLEGFEPNRYNFNHQIHGEDISPTSAMLDKGTAQAFASLHQSPKTKHMIKKASMVEMMSYQYHLNPKAAQKLFGLDLRLEDGNA